MRDANRVTVYIATGIVKKIEIRVNLNEIQTVHKDIVKITLNKGDLMSYKYGTLSIATPGDKLNEPNKQDVTVCKCGSGYGLYSKDAKYNQNNELTIFYKGDNSNAEDSERLDIYRDVGCPIVSSFKGKSKVVGIINYMQNHKGKPASFISLAEYYEELK